MPLNFPLKRHPNSFLEGPRNEESWKGALEWAAENNLAILPHDSCTEDLLAIAGSERVAVYRINTPKPDEAVSGVIPIIGTATFDPQQVQFYKIELGIVDGDNVNWVTLGDTHNTPVVNGPLENAPC